MNRTLIVAAIAACLLVTAIPSASAVALRPRDPCSVSWNPSETYAEVGWVYVEFDHGTHADLSCLYLGEVAVLA